MAAGAGIKALWRNSACLVLGSGPIQYLPKPLPLDGPAGIRCFLKQKPAEPIKHCDPEFLFVKRSFKSGFMVISE